MHASHFSEQDRAALQMRTYLVTLAETRGRQLTSELPSLSGQEIMGLN